MKTKLFFAAMLTFIGLSFCMLAAKVNGQNFVQLTRSNQEQTISLSTGQVLEIQLPRKASTGYVWCEATADNAIQKTIAKIGDGDFIYDPAPAGIKRSMIGGSGTQIIRYVGASQGTTVLTLELKKPWVKNGEVIDSYTITVVSEGKYTGTYTPPVKAIHKYKKPLTSKATQIPGIPTSWDWRSQCTAITNQESCGDCWAYATCGTLECNILINDGVTDTLSEEFITDCFTDNSCGGCNGGLCAHQAWMRSYTGANSSGGGAVYESEDPTTCNNTGVTGTCGAPYTPHQAIIKYDSIHGENANGVPSVDSMKYHIYNHGPIWVAVAADDWPDGLVDSVWVEGSAGSVDHAVVLVGWKDTLVSDNSGGYWILRNSWGTGWGWDGTGYLYISYGTDLVGNEANYIVYPKNVPPVADFTASATSNCTNGTIQFIDASYDSPTSWSWNFGDGGTSNLENPSHTYAANGTYTVSLTAFNVNGNSPPYTQTNYITIDIPPAPTVTGASGVGPCSLILTASGTDSLNWYSAPTGGTLLHTGTSFKTPILTTTTTYYVQDEVVQPVLSAGMADTTINGFYCGSAGDDIGLICNVLTDITINSVTIYAATTNSKCIWLKNSSGTTLDSVVTNLAGKQKINLNFNVPAGTGYQLVTTPDCNLWMDTSGASYPYTATGLISITGNNKTNQAYYYFFYNLQVQAPSCYSAMVPVVAKISSTGINELSEGNFDIYPNPNTGSFDIKLNDLNVQYATVSITNMLGQMLMEKKVMNNNALFHVDAPDLQPGMYYAIIHTETGVAVKKFVIE